MTSLSEKIQLSLLGHESRPGYEQIIKAARAADDGNDKALLALARTCWGERRDANLGAFFRAVLSACQRLSGQIERFECARVSHQCREYRISYELLRKLCDEGYWPAQFRLGIYLEQDENYKDFSGDGLDLLLASSGTGHREGLFMYFTYMRKKSNFPLSAYYLLRGLMMIWTLAPRANKFGEPEEPYQIIVE